MTLKLSSLGGAGTVTGSKHLLDDGDRRILVDCGMFQGVKMLRERNWAPFPIDPASVDAIVLTHAHIDHSGMLPKFVREGFAGPIYCSAATADLCKIMLMDSAKLAERDAERANRRGYSRHKPALPLYTTRDAERALELLRPVAFGAKTRLFDGVSVELRRAGHILGAATATLAWGDRRIAFSGDLGRYDDPFMHDPEPIADADCLIVESTYGDRRHPKIDPMEALGAVIEKTAARGGTIVIPAFAVGRAQALLYYVWRLKEAGRLKTLPVFLDSPMAADATELLHVHPDDHRLPYEVCRKACAVAEYVSDVERSEAVTANVMPKIVIAASGMATGGRVLHHIMSFGPDPKSTILFAGYQAVGTRGARLLEGASELKMFGQWIPIRAEIASLPELSAHADVDEIMRWLGGFAKSPTRTFIVHGEPAASDALRVRIARDLKWDACVVDPAKTYELA